MQMLTPLLPSYFPDDLFIPVAQIAINGRALSLAFNLFFPLGYLQFKDREYFMQRYEIFMCKRTSLIFSH